MLLTEPRSTCHHWLSAYVDDQRVAELPSLAAPGTNKDERVVEADAGRFSARSPAVAGGSMVHVRVAGVGSTLPAASVARTSKVCEPVASEVYALGELHAGVQAPPSSLHSK